MAVNKAIERPKTRKPEDLSYANCGAYPSAKYFSRGSQHNLSLEEIRLFDLVYKICWRNEWC
jgi:hypothetical protein